MTIDDVYDNTIADVFTTFGVSATFTPQVGDPVSCTVIVRSDAEQQASEFGSALHAKAFRIRYNLADTGQIGLQHRRLRPGGEKRERGTETAAAIGHFDRAGNGGDVLARDFGPVGEDAGHGEAARFARLANIGPQERGCAGKPLAIWCVAPGDRCLPWFRPNLVAGEGGEQGLSGREP